MKIFVTANPNAKEQRIEEIDKAHFAVKVKEPPQGGRANAAIARVLAERFGVPVSRVHLRSGFSSKRKVFEIDGPGKGEHRI